MRPLLVFISLSCVIGCGNSDTSTDMAAPDLSASMDLTVSSSGDMTLVTPYNMPGKVFCYSGPACMTSSATPVCCDSKGDGGFADTCVANAAACVAMDPQAKTFACGQAADCGTGMVCCGSTGTSSSGKTFFNSTTCAASCAAPLKQLCVTAGECKTSGASCVGQTITGRAVGICQ